MRMLLLKRLKKPAYLASSVSVTAIRGDNENEIVHKSHDDLHGSIEDLFPVNWGKPASHQEMGWLAQQHIC
jgi:hypothetical protein